MVEFSSISPSLSLDLETVGGSPRSKLRRPLRETAERQAVSSHSRKIQLKPVKRREGYKQARRPFIPQALINHKLTFHGHGCYPPMTTLLVKKKVDCTPRSVPSEYVNDEESQGGNHTYELS